MKHLILISLFLVSAYSACQPSNQAYNVWDCYTVQQGDSIYSIADFFGTSPQLVCDFNSNFLNGNCSHLQVGQELMIPPTCIEVPGQWTCEKIGKDYLNPIAEKYHIDLQWFYTYNTEYLSLTNPYSSIGMKIRTPNPVLTRQCVPGSGQYCLYINETTSLYDAAVDVYDSAINLFGFNQPWRLSYTAYPEWLLKVQRTCQPQNGTYFCYKVAPNDTFYQLGQTFGVDPYLLYEFNKDQRGVVNSTYLLWEDVELMIPVLSSEGKLPELKKENKNLLQQTNEKVNLNDQDPCQKEKDEIERIKKIIIELEAILQAIDPQ